MSYKHKILIFNILFINILLLTSCNGSQNINSKTNNESEISNQNHDSNNSTGNNGNGNDHNNNDHNNNDHNSNDQDNNGHNSNGQDSNGQDSNGQDSNGQDSNGQDSNGQDNGLDNNQNIEDDKIYFTFTNKNINHNIMFGQCVDFEYNSSHPENVVLTPSSTDLTINGNSACYRTHIHDKSVVKFNIIGTITLNETVKSDTLHLKFYNGNENPNGDENLNGNDNEGNVPDIKPGETETIENESYTPNVVKRLHSGVNEINTIKDKDGKILYTLFYSLPKNKYNAQNITSTIPNTSITSNNSLNKNIKINKLEYTNYKSIYPNKFSTEPDVYKQHFQSRSILNKFEKKEYERINKINKTNNISFKINKVVTKPSIGHEFNNVNIFNFSNNTFFQVDTSLQYESPTAYYYVAKNAKNVTNERLRLISEIYESQISKIKLQFGTAEDTDKNGKLSFIIAPFNGALGYFISTDKSPHGSGSNNGDFLYISSNYFYDDPNQFNEKQIAAAMIHEYQHMALFDHRQKKGYPDMDSWIHEGLSMLSEYVAGFGPRHREYTTDTLGKYQGTLNLTHYESNSYGILLIFMRYLTERFNLNIINDIYNHPNPGIKAIEHATKMEFNQLFIDFVTMLLVSGREVTKNTDYNIDTFNYNSTTQFAEYEKNGFSIPSDIDEYKYYNMEIPYYGPVSPIHNYCSENAYIDLKPYSFIITRWRENTPNLANITFGENYIGKVYGIYQYVKTRQ